VTTAPRTTISFRPSCTCNAGIVGGTVLDPFGGAGTTGLVADRLGRNAILIELNETYADMAERRLKQDAGMFADVR
jgi:16S rRNA G966 N2-methylase RsmD